MDTTEHLNTHGQEDHPGSIDPKEAGRKHPAKTYTAKDKVPIKESGLGREQGQTPADEHIEGNVSQIDKETVKLQQQKVMGEDYEASQNSDSTYNEINDSDIRDQNDSTKDWNAEHSKTGRNK